MIKYNVKERFAYLPILVWDVPAIKGKYYRFIWWNKFYTIQNNDRWMFKHTYKRKVVAEIRVFNFNSGMKYINGTFKY
jgi:hypothetical protein